MQFPKNQPSWLAALQDAEKLSRIFLLLVLLLTTVVFYNMVKIFLIPVFLAAMFVGLIYPLYEWLLQFTHQRRALSAFLSCLILALIMLIPTYLVVDLLRREVLQVFTQNEKTVQELLEKLQNNALSSVAVQSWLARFGVDVQQLDIASSLQQGIRGIANLLVRLINKTWAGTFQFVMHVFIMFFTMYYFFKDGSRLLQRIKYLSPLNDEHEEMLFQRFVTMSRATVKGTILIGLTQGGLGALLLWIIGFKSPIVAGIVMFFLSIIPMVGAWLVLYPVGIFYMLTGSVWTGLFVLAFTALVIGNLDNFLRPKLVGRDTGMHDLLIFFATLGGMNMFGVMGFIVGPVVASLFLTVLEIYSIEFKPQLDASARRLAAPETAPADAENSEKAEKEES